MNRLRCLLQAHRESQWKHPRLRLAQLLDSDSSGDDFHRTSNSLFPACNSGHDEIHGDLDLVMALLKWKWNIL
jgi:hypothetical protein